MLTMPPALATKSGAHRIPRSASRSADRLGGELVVGGAGDRAAAQLRGRSRRRARRRARTARRRRRRRSAPARGRSTARRGASASSRLPSSMSASTSSRAGLERAAASGPPTWPSADHRDRAAVERRRVPKARSQATRIAASDAERGPRARVAGAAALDGEAGDVAGDLRDHRMSGSEVPTSSAVM